MARKQKPERKQRTSSKSSAPTATIEPQNDDAKRELFLHHRTSWKAAKSQLDEVKKALKSDGFTVKEFQIADELTTTRGEVKIKTEVTTRLRVARWLGHPMGQQLDLFAKGAETARRDPRDEGRLASMENRPGKPPEEYAPDSVEYRDWMDGYHAHQAEIVPGAQNGGVSRSEFHGHLQKRHEEVDRKIRGIGDQPATHQVQ